MIIAALGRRNTSLLSTDVVCLTRLHQTQLSLYHAMSQLNIIKLT